MGKKRGKKTLPLDSPKDHQIIEHGFLKEEFIEYYHSQLVPEALSQEEFDKMIASFKESLPHTFTISANSENYLQNCKEIDQFLHEITALGFECQKIDLLDNEGGSIYQLSIDKPTLKKTPSLKQFREWLHNHTECGDITRQELVSMLPPFLLDIPSTVPPNFAILDACAAPGSKTSQILEKIKGAVVIANDSNLDRCRTLVHLTNRYPNGSTLVTCHSADFLPSFCLYDQIICDVPCSCDGTLRKNPDAGYHWNSRSGNQLHRTQREILLRCIQLLKIGGRIVYSTCSLNPIEDEAVIGSVISESGGAIQIVDCSSCFPRFLRGRGLSHWFVYDINGKLTNYESIPEERKKYFSPTMFPVYNVDLSNCMRFYPHQNNTGGFFIAVLQKTSETNWPLKNPKKPPIPWLQAPFTQLQSDILQQIKEDYGMEIDGKLLFARAESTNSVREVYYLNEAAASVVSNTEPKSLRALSCGTRIFSWKSLKGDSVVKAIPSFEGITIVDRVATKRKFVVTPPEMKELLLVGNTGVPVSKFGERVNQIGFGGVIVKIEGTHFIYGGLMTHSSLTLHIKKEMINGEVFKLMEAFPELKQIEQPRE